MASYGPKHYSATQLYIAKIINWFEDLQGAIQLIRFERAFKLAQSQPKLALPFDPHVVKYTDYVNQIKAIND